MSRPGLSARQVAFLGYVLDPRDPRPAVRGIAVAASAHDGRAAAGVRSTLRSLIRRGLVRWVESRGWYDLTEAGRAALPDDWRTS